MDYILKIVHLGGIFFQGPISYLHLKTLDGEIGIMPGHVPIISSIQVSGMKYVTKDKKEIECAIAGGILFVDINQIIILTTNIQNRKNIDIEEAKKAKALLEAKLNITKLKSEEAHLRLAIKQELNLIQVKEKGI